VLAGFADPGGQSGNHCAPVLDPPSFWRAILRSRDRDAAVNLACRDITFRLIRGDFPAANAILDPGPTTTYAYDYGNKLPHAATPSSMPAAAGLITPAAPRYSAGSCPTSHARAGRLHARSCLAGMRAWGEPSPSQGRLNSPHGCNTGDPPPLTAKPSNRTGAPLEAGFNTAGTVAQWR